MRSRDLNLQVGLGVLMSRAVVARTIQVLQQRTIRSSVTNAERELFGQDIEALQGLFIGRRQCFFDDFCSAGMLDNFGGRQCCQC